MAEVHETANASIDKRSDVDDKPVLSKFWLGEIAASKKRDETWHKRADKVIARYRDERDQDRYADSERRANILWSNTETLKSALFQSLGNPDVRRRFPKKGADDKAARQAALSLERSLSYCSDAYDAESQIEACIEDYLLPGRGSGWVVYEADVAEGYGEEEDAGQEAPNGKVRANTLGAPSIFPTPGVGPSTFGQNGVNGSGNGYGQQSMLPTGPQINNQSVKLCHVFFKDFLTSAGRKWSDVWWVARGHDYSRDELKKYWPKHAEKIPLNQSVSGYNNTAKGSKEEEDTFKRARVWEIWDKSKKERVHVAEEYDLILDNTPDPYKLKDFFPTVEPIYGVKTTSSLTPIPEYTLYQDQAEELDILQTRLCRITDALKRRGVYDASAEGPDNQLATLAHAGDNQFVPYRNFAALMEKGGLAGVFMTEDLKPFAMVLEGLSAREQALLQKIYEITGISDIIRGASNPNETATAQKIKGQFGSLRLQKRQKRIQCFIRDLYRLKAEIIAEHFTREQLVEMTSIDMPLKAEQEQAKMMLAAIQQREQQAKMMAQGPPQGGPPQQGAPMNGGVPPPNGGGMPGGPPQPMMPPAPPPVSPQVMEQLIATAKAVPWEDIQAILRSDQRRGYKVDIETDATNALDSETEKQQRIEFITAMGTMLSEALPMIAQAPPPAAAALVTLLKENAMFAATAFKAGRTMEEAYEDAFTKLEELAKSQASQPPKPSPEEAQLKADMEMKKADLQFQQQSKQMEFQFKQAEAQQSAQIEQRKMEHEAKLKEQELQHTMQIETFKAQQESQLQQYKAEQDMQMRSREFEAQQIMAERQSAMDAQRADRDFAMQDRKQGQTEAAGFRKEGFEREKFDRAMEQSERKIAVDAGIGGTPPAPDDSGVQAQLAQLSEQVEQLTQMLAMMMGGGQSQQAAQMGA